MSVLRFRSRRRLLQHLSFLALGVGTIAHGAKPSREQLISGQASFLRSGSTLSITQGSEKAIIHWQDFSIGS